MRRIWTSLLLATALVTTSAARADGRFPAASAVVLDPHDDKTIYVRATFGVLATRDAGESWRWICERAIGVGANEDPTYVVTPTGTLVGATSSGVAVSRDGGCTFEFAGGQGAHVLTDVVVRPDGEVVGVSSVRGANAAQSDNHVVTSKDDAKTFTASGGPIDPSLRLGSLAVAPSDPVRMYLSGVRGDGVTRTAAVLVSYDAGMTWAPRPFTLGTGETAAIVEAVDPKNPDRVYARTAGALDATTRLLVTDDAGKTWKKIVDSSSPLLGFALSEDGARVFAGSREGVSSSATDTFSFTKGAPIDTQCLALSGRALWACSTERSGFFVGASRSRGKSFDARLHLDEIKGPLECPAESTVAKACATEWAKLRASLGLPEEGAKRSTGPAGPALHGSGQRTGPTKVQFGFAALAVLALGAMAAYHILQKVRRPR